MSSAETVGVSRCSSLDERLHRGQATMHRSPHGGHNPAMEYPAPEAVAREVGNLCNYLGILLHRTPILEENPVGILEHRDLRRNGFEGYVANPCASPSAPWTVENPSPSFLLTAVFMDTIGAINNKASS